MGKQENQTEQLQTVRSFIFVNNDAEEPNAKLWIT